MSSHPFNLGRARFAWCLYDWANSAFATVILASVLPVYFAALVPPSGAPIAILGWRHSVPASALWGYGVSLSMLLVALAAPWIGTRADRKKTRRRMLVLCGLFGSLATAMLGLAGPGDYLLALALFIVANVGFAAGNIFYNSFLPALADGPDLDRLSARGFALGYLGGGLMLLLAFLLIQGYDAIGFPDRGAATRTVFVLTGLWWGGFALPAFLSLREDVFIHPAPSLPHTWRDYFRIFGEIRRHRDLLVFLIAFLFYNDGIQTVIAVSAIFGKEELGLSQTTILGTFLMIQFVAMPGSLLYGRAATRWGSKPAILVGLVFFTAITGYAFTMRESWEFWILGFAVALIFGGLQAVSRSLYAALIPPGKTAEFFAFYAISGKFASIFGPLVFAVIADLTGSTRLSILALSGFFVLGIILLSRVDVDRGRRIARETIPGSHP